MRISDWSSDVCSSDLIGVERTVDDGASAGCGKHARPRRSEPGNGRDPMGKQRRKKSEAFRPGAAAMRPEQLAARPPRGRDPGAVYRPLVGLDAPDGPMLGLRSEEQTSEPPSLMRSSHAVYGLSP